MRSKFSKIALAAILGIAMVFTFSCSNDSGGSGIGSNLYPYTEYEIVYLGFKSGLTSTSSQESFHSALVEVAQEYSENHPDSDDDDDVILDGITYTIMNRQTITGGVSTEVWNLYYEELKKYSYGIGSCWGFSYGKIPSKGWNGTGYILYTIVTSSSPSVYYVAVKVDLVPKNKAGLAKNATLQLSSETEVKAGKHIFSKLR